MVVPLVGICTSVITAAEIVIALNVKEGVTQKQKIQSPYYYNLLYLKIPYNWVFIVSAPHPTKPFLLCSLIFFRNFCCFCFSFVFCFFFFFFLFIFYIFFIFILFNFLFIFFFIIIYICYFFFFFFFFILINKFNFFINLNY